MTSITQAVLSEAALAWIEWECPITCDWPTKSSHTNPTCSPLSWCYGECASDAQIEIPVNILLIAWRR